MKGKIVFTFKPNSDDFTSVKQNIRFKDVSTMVLVNAFAGFMKSVTPTRRDAEKFAAAVYCVVSGKVPPSQILDSFDEPEESTDE